MIERLTKNWVQWMIRTGVIERERAPLYALEWSRIADVVGDNTNACYGDCSRTLLAGGSNDDDILFDSRLCRRLSCEDANAVCNKVMDYVYCLFGVAAFLPVIANCANKYYYGGGNFFGVCLPPCG